jgi:threonylcarbamoyladenosine tRNA methylthiotransferase MtaB
MNTFSIYTLGCKVNQYESQQIRQFLESLGLDHVKTSQKPQFIIVNTCCVTQSASAKSRQYVRKAKRLSPNADIIACGCLPTVQIGELNGLDKYAHIIEHRKNLYDELKKLVVDHFGSANSDSSTYSQRIPRTSLNRKLNNKKNLEPPISPPQLTSYTGQTRAFLKVQDGCDGYCTYCIVPKTRPVVQSKTADEALSESRSLVDAGHKEIVVTGIFLGAYGQTTVRRKNWQRTENSKLADLLVKIAKIPGLARIRLSSLEPGDVNDQLLDVFCQNPNIMPHLHLSLQSGSDNILRKMARQYTTDDFIDKIEIIKSRLDRPAITTDIIVGFPGEKEADFEQTVDLSKEIGFAKMHVFAFSPRKGTIAANMQDIVDTRVIKERSKILRELDVELQRQFRQKFVGEVAKILLENDGTKASGRSERYFIVKVCANHKLLKKNDLVKVKLISNEQNSMVGELI